jgi:hypothetical protein
MSDATTFGRPNSDFLAIRPPNSPAGGAPTPEMSPADSAGALARAARTGAIYRACLRSRKS